MARTLKDLLIGPRLPDLPDAPDVRVAPLQTQAPAFTPGLGMPAPAPVRGPVHDTPEGGSAGRVAYVGDSLGVGTAPYVRGRENVLGGRSSAHGVGALSRMLRKGDVGTVVFDLGTNDPNAQALRQSFRRAREMAPGAHFIVPTVQGPNARQKNRYIRSLADKRGVTVVDWARMNRGLLSSDGIHATPHGYRRRARMIRGAF